MTPSGRTLQKSEIFCAISWVISLSVLQIRMSGWMPISRSLPTDCCVGFVFISPEARK